MVLLQPTTANRLIASRQIWLFLAVTALFLVALLFPEAASAAFTGDFAPKKEVITNVDGSLGKWWRALAVPALWASLAGLVWCVLWNQGRGAWIPVATGAIFLFGEMLMKGAIGLMG